MGYRGLAGCLRLTGMTRLQDYARQLASPMELLGEVSSVREADLRRLGLPRQEARSLLALADVYFGPTHYVVSSSTSGRRRFMVCPPDWAGYVYFRSLRLKRQWN